MKLDTVSFNKSQSYLIFQRIVKFITPKQVKRGFHGYMFEFFFKKKVQFYSNKEPKIEEEKKPVDFFKSFSIQVKIVSSFKKMVSVTYLTFLLLQKA